MLMPASRPADDRASMRRLCGCRAAVGVAAARVAGHSALSLEAGGAVQDPVGDEVDARWPAARSPPPGSSGADAEDDAVLVFPHHAAPVGRRRLHAEAEEGQRRQEQHAKMKRRPNSATSGDSALGRISRKMIQPQPSPRSLRRLDEVHDVDVDARRRAPSRKTRVESSMPMTRISVTEIDRRAPRARPARRSASGSPSADRRGATAACRTSRRAPPPRSRGWRRARRSSVVADAR